MKLPNYLIMSLIILLAMPALAGKKSGRILNVLEQINKQTLPSKCMFEPKAGISRVEFDKALSRCATEICGKAKKKNFGDLYTEAVFSPTNEINTELRDVIVRSRKLEVKADLVKMQILENLLKAPWRIKLENSSIVSANISQMGAEPSPVFERKDGKLVINRAATEEAMRGLPLSLRRRLVPYYEELFTGAHSAELLNRASLPLFHLLGKKYPNLEFGDALKKDAEEIKGLLEHEKFSKEDSAEFKNLISKILSGKKLSRHEVDEYAGQSVGFFAYLPHVLHPETYGPILNSPFEPIEQFITRNQIEKKVQSHKELVEILDEGFRTDPAFTEFSLRSTVELIQRPYEAQLSIAPDESDIEKAHQLIHKAKEQIKSKFIPHFSKKSQEILISKLDSIRFRLPLTKAELKQKFKEKVDELDRINRDYIEKHENKPIGKYDSQDVLEFYNHKDWKGTSKVATTILNEIDFKFFTDAAYSDYFGIEVSAGALKEPVAGLFVIKHEIGHVLSSALMSPEISEESRAVFNGVRKCLDRRYGEEPNYKEDHYVEEDWADLVAGSSFDGKTLNGACFLLKKEDMVDSRTKYQLKLAETGSLGSSSDPHSTPLFRVLHTEYLMKGKLPPKCEEAAKKAESFPDFRSCLEFGLE